MRREKQMKVLDTDVLSAIVKPNPPRRLQWEISQLSEVHTTAVTLGEILYGLEKFGSVRLRRLYEQKVFPFLIVLPFDEEAAHHYGELRAVLEERGEPLSEADLMIASIVLSRGGVLVTGNVAHFSRVPGMRVENWLE